MFRLQVARKVAPLAIGLFLSALPLLPGPLASGLVLDGPIPLDLTISDEPPATLDAPRHRAKYLLKPNPIQITNGLALDGRGSLYINRVLRNSIVRYDLATGAAVEIAGDYEPTAEQLQTPDDTVFDASGHLYVVEYVNRTVAKIAPDGTRTRLPGAITDGATGPNGIAFRGDRLFTTEMSFDAAHRGALWEVDPAGMAPARPATSPLSPLSGPQGFAFGFDNLAYVPEIMRGTIAIVDVDRGTVVGRLEVGGLLAALDIDAQGRIVVLQTDTGRILRGDPLTGAFTLLARGEPGLDNLAIAADGTIYVSNYLTAEILRIDPQNGATTRLFPKAGPTGFPVSLTLTEEGTAWVSTFNSIIKLAPNGSFTRVMRLFIDEVAPALPILFTGGAAELDGWLYFSDAFPTVDQRVSRQNLATGTREVVARGFALPTHIRKGPDGKLLVVDQVAGVISLLDPALGAAVPIVSGFRSPGGLAYDAASSAVYYSESAAGRVIGIGLGTRARVFVAEGLTTPEGVALDHDGGLLVVEGDAQRLLRIDLATGERTVVATGLPTRAVGITSIPGFNLTSDVAVRPTGEILVTGAGDGSVVELKLR